MSQGWAWCPRCGDQGVSPTVRQTLLRIGQISRSLKQASGGQLTTIEQSEPVHETTRIGARFGLRLCDAANCALAAGCHSRPRGTRSGGGHLD